MARPKVKTRTYRVTLSEGVGQLLERIAEIGIHGPTESEVIRSFVQHEIERLVVQQGMLRTPLVNDPPRRS